MQERLRKMPPKNSDLPGEQAVIPQILRISQAVLRRSVRQMTKELSAEDKKAYESLNNAANDIIFGNGDLSADSSGDSSGDNSADGSKDIPRGILSDNSDQASSESEQDPVLSYQLADLARRMRAATAKVSGTSSAAEQQRCCILIDFACSLGLAQRV